MNDHLYFIPILAKALQQRDPEQSLRQAFDRIYSLGSQSCYALGFEQFKRFMATVIAHHKSNQNRRFVDHGVNMLIVELVSEMFEGSDEERQEALSVIQSQPQWRKEYDDFTTEIKLLSERPEGIGISIYRENESFQSVQFSEIPGVKSIDGVTAGRYRICFSTGRLIWEGNLSERDLIWTLAFPRQPLELAADTEEREGHPTKELSALSGEISIRVFAGLECGKMRITLNASRDS